MKTTLIPKTPNIIPQSGDNQALIGVGVIIGPEYWNYVSDGLLGAALEAGFKRAALPTYSKLGFFHTWLFVRQFRVPWETRGAFVTSAKQSLSELLILENATIAVGKSAETLHIVWGRERTMDPFLKTFCRKEYLEAWKAEMKDREVRAREFIVEWGKANASEKQERFQQDAGGRDQQ